MKLDLGEALERHAPLALVAALLLQGAAAVWWVSAKDRDAFFLEQRVTHLETRFAHTSEAQAEALERLTRIEERVNAQLSVLDRIERQLGARK